MTDEQVVLADVAAELDGGEPVVALLVGRWQSERSDLIDHICARLAWNSTRVIRIATSGVGSVDIRGFCNLLVAAAPAGTIAGDDPAERLRGVLVSPHAGKRRLTLIVEDADALSTVALAFVVRLAVASSARPRRVQVLLLGSHALQPRLAGIGPAAVKRLDEFPTSGFNPLPTKRRTREVLLALAATGCLAAVVVTGTLRPGADNRLSAKAGAALEAQPALGRPSGAFALGEGSSTTAPSESTSLFPTLTLAQSVPKDAAELPADAAPLVAPNSGFAPQPQTATASPPTEPAPQQEAEAVTEAIAELLAQLDALLARRSAGGAAASDAEITELLTQLDALLARRPAEDVAPPGVAQSATPLDPPSTPAPAPAPALEAASGATTTAVAPPPAGPPAVPLTPTGPLAAPAAPAETAAPGTATAVEAVQSGTGSLAAPAPPAETAAPSAATAAEAVQSGTGSLAAPARPAETAEPGTATAGANAAQSGTESVAAPARPAGTAVSSMATAAVAGAARPAEPQRPPAGAPPAAVAALLARGDALIAFGDVAAARLVYQRAAARDSARGATAMGRTYDPRFLQSIGAIGVVADPDAAAAWYRKGAALGDEDAAPLLGGLK
ncbi:MAG TPA: hypothetical protein VEX11_05280 [Acetobacteraceae bacterium]|nr:hypothetical protein [Acetobacteraceae bacterium]